MTISTIIKIFFFVSVFSSITFSQPIFWEDIGNEKKDIVYSDRNTSKLAVDYSFGLIKATDDSLTFALLDQITESTIFNPLHFWVFNKILINADGALAEIMGEYCYKIISAYPNIVIRYLTKMGKTDVDNILFAKYGNYLGWGFAADIKSNIRDLAAYKNFKNTLLLYAFDEADIETVQLLIQQIDSAFEKSYY